MADRVYFDTSALVKWYVLENQSEEVQGYLRENAPVDITSLTVAEMRSVMARRRREGNIDPSMESLLFATFLEEIHSGHLERHDVTESMWEGAIHLMGALYHLPLRTLDALHLSAAREIGAGVLATADRVMADAGRESGLEIAWFGAGMG